MAKKNAKEKVYTDLRPRFLRGLIEWEEFQRQRHYLRQAAEWTSRAIVSLELAESPVKSIKQAQKLEGIGDELGKRLSQLQVACTFNPHPPAPGMFISSAGALLAALVICRDQISEESVRKDDLVLVPETMLRSTAQELCEENISQSTEDANGPALCPAWWRLTVLANRGMVKKRSLKRQPVYELLPKGEETALRIMAKAGIQKVTEVPRFQPPEQVHDEAQTAALYTNDNGSEGLVLLVDTQEWGGDRVGLNQLCEMLQRKGVCYRSKKLPLGDYMWIWRCGGQEVLLPILVERKRVDDLARSLVDGRYLSQKTRMVEWKARIAHDMADVSLKYVVEGQAADYVVRCKDGCGAVLKCGYPTAQQIQVTLEEIDRGPDFDLIQTEDINGTVNLFKVMTADLKQRVESGEFYDLLDRNLTLNVMMRGLGDRVGKDGSNDSEIILIDEEKEDHKADMNQNLTNPDYEEKEKNPREACGRNAVDQVKPSIHLANIPLSQYHSSPAVGSRTFAGQSSKVNTGPYHALLKGHVPLKTPMHGTYLKRSTDTHSGEGIPAQDNSTDNEYQTHHVSPNRSSYSRSIQSDKDFRKPQKYPVAFSMYDSGKPVAYMPSGGSKTHVQTDAYSKLDIQEERKCEISRITPNSVLPAKNNPCISKHKINSRDIKEEIKDEMISVDDTDIGNDMAEHQPMDYMALQHALFEKFNKVKLKKNYDTSNSILSENRKSSQQNDTCETVTSDVYNREEELQKNSHQNIKKPFKIVPCKKSQCADNDRMSSSKEIHCQDMIDIPPVSSVSRHKRVNRQTEFCVFSASKSITNDGISDIPENVSELKKRRRNTESAHSCVEPMKGGVTSNVSIGENSDSDSKDNDLPDPFFGARAGCTRKKLKIGRTKPQVSGNDRDKPATSSSTESQISDDDDLPDIDFAQPRSQLVLPSVSEKDNKQDPGQLTDPQDDDYTEKIEMVLAVLPDVSIETIKSKLCIYSGDVDMVINTLLDI